MTSSGLRIYTTNRCNSNCRYCYRGLESRSNKGDQHHDIDLSTLITFLDSQPSRYDVIKISGGEPSFYPFIDELVSYLKNKKYFVELYSNGALTQLKDSTLTNIDKFNLSLDSIDSSINNDIRRNNNATNDFLFAVQHLHSIGQNNIEVQVTISQASIESFESTLFFLVYNLGITTIKVSDIIEERYGFFNDLRVTPEELEKILDFVERIRRNKRYRVNIKSSFYNQKKYAFLHKDLSHLISLFINEFSKIYYFIGENNYFYVGNLLKDSNKHILNREEEMKPFIEKFSKYAFSKLKKCSLEHVSPAEFLYNRDIIEHFAINHVELLPERKPF